MKIQTKITMADVTQLVRQEIGLDPEHELQVEVERAPRITSGKIAAIKKLRDAINHGTIITTRDESIGQVSTSGFYIGLADAKTLVERIMEVL